MNKLVTRHSTLVTAVLVAAVAATSAAARTVSVAAIRDGTATAAFGDVDGAAYTLAWGYGPADGGAATNAWAHFETLGEVAADATTATYPLPAGWGEPSRTCASSCWSRKFRQRQPASNTSRRQGRSGSTPA